ncbi:uncharacterized protein [Primulina eburnea]|uniref:uncharacterized protein n=1 Tax=Primulina eburnea TaxID=1245227 RepID=UPI003C6C125C
MNTETGLFKLFLPKTGGTEMLIPLPFMRWIGGSLPKKIFLRDRYLNLWRVKTTQVGEKWYFKNGWDKFVKDNKILRGYSLVFDYFEEDLFDIKVLGPNGRQTVGAGALVSMDIDDETEEEEDDREEVDRVLKRQEDLSEESKDDDDDDEIEDDDDEEDAYRALKRHEESSEEREDEDDDEIEDANYLPDQEGEQELSEQSEGDDNEIEDARYLPNQEIKVEQVKKGKFILSLFLKNLAFYIDIAVGSTKRKRKSKIKIPTPLYPKYSGFEIFEKGLAKQPANPHFVVEVKAKRTNDLFIPLPLVDEHKLDLPKPHMLLVDPHGREFHARYRRWSDGRILYTREWKFLLRRNNIVVGDTCICEFVEGDMGLYLKVSFLRKSSG